MLVRHCMARELKKRNNGLRSDWINSCGKDLKAVIASFKQSLVTVLLLQPRQSVARESNYFDKHKQRMQYPTLRAAGYHIGSGSVESACKRIIGARLKQAGMIWTREGAEAIAQLASHDPLQSLGRILDFL